MSASGIARLAFSGSAAGLAWVTVGYPLALALLPARPTLEDGALPTVTVVVPAYREHDALPAKLAGLRSTDYPEELLDLVVVIDGDAVLAARARHAAPSATVLLLDERGGKPGALNAALAHATGEVVLLTDAHTPLHPGALRRAVRHFADPEVVGVTGRWSTRGGAYAAYEGLLLRLESRSGSVAGAFGSFFAVRRDHVPAFPATVVNDDLWLLLQLLRAGGRVVHEPAAAAVEAPLAPRDELERRRRIGAGRAALMGELRDLPGPVRWRVASHKLGRLAVPGLLLGTGASSLVLARRPAYRAVAAVHVAVLAAGLLSAVGVELPGRGRRVSRTAREVTLGVAATGGGIVRAARGGQAVRWTAVR